ncbi:MAG: hypothetical protein ACRC8K_02290, partial [Waterburya sp.]
MSQKKLIYAACGVIVVNLALFFLATPPAFAQEAATNPIDLGDTAWMLVATGLVLLMTPGLA